MTHLRWLGVVSGLIATAMLAGSALADPGDLDPSFGANGTVRECFLTAQAGETAQGEVEHSDMDEGGGGWDGGLVVHPEAAVVDQPGKGSLDGLVTNDKFCLTRRARLRLRWHSRGGSPPRAAHA